MNVVLRRLLLKAALDELMQAQAALQHAAENKASSLSYWTTREELEGHVSPNGKPLTYDPKEASKIATRYAEEVSKLQQKVEEALKTMHEAIDQCFGGND